MLDIVGVHHTLHHLAINRQRNIYLRGVYHGGPMLVAYGVPKLDGCGDDCLRLHTG